MVPFESFGMVFYSLSIVTMAVSLAISQIFSIKEWPDREIWVWDRSRSFKKAWFYRPCTTFCWSAIVTRVYDLVPFSSHLTLNNIMNLSGLQVTQDY